MSCSCPQGRFSAVLVPILWSLVAISVVRHLSAASLDGLTGKHSWAQLKVLAGPAKHLLVCFWGAKSEGIHGIGASLETGQGWAFALDFGPLLKQHKPV